MRLSCAFKTFNEDAFTSVNSGFSFFLLIFFTSSRPSSGPQGS